jgi:hypothetical protein
MNDYFRDSRLTGLWEFRFMVRGRGGVVFEHAIVARHGAQAQAEVRGRGGKQRSEPTMRTSVRMSGRRRSAASRSRSVWEH